MNNQLGSRLVYENVQVALAAAGLTADEIQNAVLSQSFLRFEQPLNIASTNFSFPILNNATTSGNPIRATEQRLNLQDAFYCSEIGFYLVRAASAADASFLYNTYPNSVTFPTGGAAPAPLNAVYNGKLSIAVNNSVIVPAMDMIRFKQTPQTQLTAATNSPVDQFDGANDRSTLVVLEPNIVFIGSKNTQLVLTLPQNITAIDTFTYAVIIVKGILAQNVTIIT